MRFRYILLVLLAAGAGIALTARFTPLGSANLPPAVAPAVAQARHQLDSWFGRPQVAAQPVDPAERHHIVAEGRLVTYPDGQVAIASELMGTIAAIPVEERGQLRKGQLVAQLRSEEQEAALAEAKSKLAEVDADIAFADWKLGQMKNVNSTGAVSAIEVQECVRSLDAAKARRITVLATVHRLETTLAKLRIVSPIDGTVLSRTANAGEAVAPGQTLATVADLGHLRIEAEVDEFDTGRIRLGAEVTITAEGYNNQSWKGRVEEIPDAVVERRMKPEDPARPTDTRILPVKIAFSQPVPLKLGQRVDVEIETAPAAAASANGAVTSTVEPADSAR